jgi:hypothetical protein
VADSEFLQATGFSVLDRVLGRESDWHTFFKARVQAAEQRRQASEKRRLASRKKGTEPSREASAYVGTYRDRAYGDLVVERDGKGLVVRWSSFRARLEPFHFDTFRMRASSEDSQRLEGELATFALDRAGNIERVRFLGRTFGRVAEK